MRGMRPYEPTRENILIAGEQMFQKKRIGPGSFGSHLGTAATYLERFLSD